MIYTWQIFVDGESKGFIEAMTEYSACEKFYLKHGGSSLYTGIGMSQIKAERYE